MVKTVLQEGARMVASGEGMGIMTLGNCHRQLLDERPFHVGSRFEIDGAAAGMRD